MDNLEGGQPYEPGPPAPPEPEASDFGLVGMMITRPAEAFERIARRPRFVAPVVLVALGYLFYYIGRGFLVLKLGPMYASLLTKTAASPAAVAIAALVGSLCCFPINAVFSWFLWAGVLFLAAMIAGRRGNFWAVFSAVGYAFLPYVFAGLLGGIAMAIISQSLAVQTLVTSGVRRALLISLGFVALFSIWNVALCAVALEKTMGLPRPVSAAIVIVLKAISLAFSFATTALMAGA